MLIVEDDAHIAELLRMHLRDEGYEVHHAADGHAGLRELERGYKLSPTGAGEEGAA